MFFLPIRTAVPQASAPCKGMKYKYLNRAEGYAQVCRKNGSLANKAGFLRHEKIAPADYAEFCRKNPDEAALIEALFEDEALNTDTKKLSATVMNLYMKYRVGYGEKETDEICVVSCHDEEDGV